MVGSLDERSSLLHDAHDGERELLSLDEFDPENPKAWPRSKKLFNIFIVALMAILTPLASSIFAPGINEIAEGLHTSTNAVVACQSGFVIMLGVGPLILAPMSETFGRRVLYLVCFSIFALLQVPTTFSPNIETLIALRAVSGFFGSVGIANGGGTISDMFESHERAGVFGWYLLGPLLGPTLGPLFGGIITQYLGWRWLFGILAIVCSCNLLLAFFFLRETYTPVILAARKRKMETAHGREFYFEGEDLRPLSLKILTSIKRPLYILLTQPMVLTMATYQALIFSTTYSIYTNMQDIYGSAYGFSTLQVGLLYLGPGLGFLFSVWFLVPRIDTVYNNLAARHGNSGKPEYRLPLANIGAVLLPPALLVFGWAAERHVHWFVTSLVLFFYGIGQVVIFNAVQNYYIDCFSHYAASAIAAGAVFRSLVGGIVPMFAPGLFDKLGYGWGMSVFALVALILAPSPVLFYYVGERLRERFTIEL